MTYAESVFKFEIPEEVIDTPLYLAYYSSRPETVKTYLRIHKILVAHDFVVGYIWVKYDLGRINSSGHEFSGRETQGDGSVVLII